MRLTSLLCIIFCSGQMLMAKEGKAQTPEETTIHLELKNESLRAAFRKIEDKTIFRFAYNRKQVESYTNISLAEGKYNVKEIIETVLSHTPLSFKVIRNNIVIFPVEESVQEAATNNAVSIPAADGTIKGKITNNKGEPIAGASVLLVGTDKGMSANADGTFTLTGIKPGKYVLRVSVVGFQNDTRNITVGDGQVLDLDFELKESNSSLSEVVVTGYSRQSKRDVTGAVSTVSADVIAKSPVADVASVLQGRVAGVTVDGQGGPGNEQVVRVRGIGTLGDNDPLYVIDGVQTKGGLNLVNTNDIESITVLKDAASCALYGARGSNGVIVITTKRGKNGTPRLEYNAYIGYEIPRKFPEIMSPQQYADALWGYLANSGQSQSNPLFGNGSTPVLPDFLISKKASPTFQGVAANSAAADPSLYNFANYRIMKANKTGTNWFDESFDKALSQSHQLAVSGANDKSNYAVTFNYLDNNGILLNSFFKRYSIRANTEFKVKPWLRFGENLQFAYTQGNTVSDHTDQNVFASLYKTSPLLPVYDIAGNYAGTNGGSGLNLGDNPIIGLEGSKKSKGYTARMLGSAFVEVEPIKNLVFQSKIAIDYLPFQNRFSQDTLPQVAFPVTSFKFSEFAGYSLEWRATNKLSYSITINDIHKLSAFVAYEASEYNYRGLGASSDSMFYNLPGFQVVSNRTGIRWQLDGSRDRSTYLSQIGNVNYSLLDRYLLTVTVRRDGSSRFTELKRYGVFPSASVGWRVSGEKFMEKINWLNDLKLRASVGTSGNDAIGTGLTVNQYYTDPSYTYYDLSGNNNTANFGFALTQLGNPLLQWEINKTTNLGFDAVLLANRVNVSFNWFNRKTDKLLYSPPVTALQGDAGAPVQNIMNFTNKGIELELGYHSIKRGDFSYDINANISTYRNNVTYIDGRPETFIPGGLYARAIPLTRSTVGRPVSSFYGFVYDGIIQSGDSAGHFKFKDISGPDGKPDGVIDDDHDRIYIGSPHPKFSYGLSLNVNYKNFDFNIFFQGVYGNKIMNYWRAYSEWPGQFTVKSLDTWTPTNTDARLPIYDGKAFKDDRPSTFFVEDGSYLRLKSMQLGYTLPQMKGISKLRVYLQAWNIATITKYSGLDPEVNTGAPGSAGIDFGGNFPISMKLLFGVNLGL
ncbi:MAG: TonB-dependent receptor [Agriterribacter sp.]